MTDTSQEFTLDDIKIGQKHKFEVVITESMVNEFAKLSGDYNPLHMNDSYAKSTDFKQRICHGMLVASFFSRLTGMYIPGKKALYFSQSLKFVMPCFLNEKVFVEGEVIDKSDASRIITLKTTITSYSGKCIVDGQAKVLVRK